MARSKLMIAAAGRSRATQGRATVVVRLGDAVIDPDRAVVDLERLGMAAEVLQDDAQIAHVHPPIVD